jgi:hypothetical protein
MTDLNTVWICSRPASTPLSRRSDMDRQAKPADRPKICTKADIGRLYPKSSRGETLQTVDID